MENLVENDIKVSERAAKEIKQLMEENSIDSSFGLRLSVKGGGCSGLTYKLGFDDKINEIDTVIESHGVKLIVDAKSLFYLMGCELDYSGGLNGKGFIFNNPNAKKTCGCGESFGV